MHHIERMHTLQNLMLGGVGESPAIDVATARAIASLPDLRALTLRAVRFEEHALTLLLAPCEYAIGPARIGQATATATATASRRATTMGCCSP